MKSLEKLKSVIRTIELSNGDGSFNSTLDLLHEFIVDNEPKQKKTAFRDFCSEKKQYPALTGVFHDAEKKVAVATDGYMLITSKSEYNEDFAGNIIDAYGKCIDDRFPNYSSAMPSDLGLYKPYPISADDIRAGMRQLKAAVKSQGISKPDFIVRHDATDSYYSPVMLIKFADYCDGEILIHDSCRAAIHYGEDFRVLIVPKSPMTKHLFTTTINGWTFSVC